MIDLIVPKTVMPMQGAGADGSWTHLKNVSESKYKTNVMEHVVSKHVNSTGIICPLCDIVCVNRKGLRNHMYRYHKS